MKIIKPSVVFYGPVPNDYAGALKFIEQAGRTCYKSEDKITPTSAEGFVARLISAGHLAMVEHSNFVVRTRSYRATDVATIGAISGKYLNCVQHDGHLYVGGNLTAWYQACMHTTYKALFEPFVQTYGALFGLKSHEPHGFSWEACSFAEIPETLHRYSARFVCDRGVSHELVRHRPCSFAQESTRYVNYGGKDTEFIEPWWWGTQKNAFLKTQFKSACTEAESAYKNLLLFGCSPQAARAVLPNALKTEVVVTADSAEWAHIHKLRTSIAAHPDIQRVMNMLPWEKLL